MGQNEGGSPAITHACISSRSPVHTKPQGSGLQTAARKLSMRTTSPLPSPQKRPALAPTRRMPFGRETRFAVVCASAARGCAGRQRATMAADYLRIGFVKCCGGEQVRVDPFSLSALMITLPSR